MKRVSLNFMVDLVGFVVLVSLVMTGGVLKYILPPGSGGRGHGAGGAGGFAKEIKTFCQMSRHEWGDVHFYLSVVFVGIVLLHLVLHYQWIKAYLVGCFKCKE